jgi:hypothetical protein
MDETGSLERLENITVYFTYPFVPERVRIFGGMSFKVWPYKKNPLQCTRCCHMGHSFNVCKRRNPICAFCSNEHKTTECPDKSNPNKSPKCILCKSSHMASSKECPVYQNQVKQERNIPFQNLHNRQSLFQPRNTDSKSEFLLSTMQASSFNKFELLAHLKEEESSLETEVYNQSTMPTNQLQANHPTKHKDSYSSVAKRSKPLNNQTVNKAPPYLPTSYYTEISSRERASSDNTQTHSLLKTYMDRQEVLLHKPLSRQDKLEEKLNQQQQQIPQIVAQTISLIIPELVKQIQSALTHTQTKDN